MTETRPARVQHAAVSVGIWRLTLDVYERSDQEEMSNRLIQHEQSKQSGDAVLALFSLFSFEQSEEKEFIRSTFGPGVEEKFNRKG